MLQYIHACPKYVLQVILVKDNYQANTCSGDRLRHISRGISLYMGQLAMWMRNWLQWCVWVTQNVIRIFIYIVHYSYFVRAIYVIAYDRQTFKRLSWLRSIQKSTISRSLSMYLWYEHHYIFGVFGAAVQMKSAKLKQVPAIPIISMGPYAWTWHDLLTSKPDAFRLKPLLPWTAWVAPLIKPLSDC